ncbi:MAG: hypothetical protein PHP62_00755 [Candidatus Moranbacteria bacterium]|nr:hypothetical protein [Candidatus Moranbacteria bacterium]
MKTKIKKGNVAVIAIIVIIVAITIVVIGRMFVVKIQKPVEQVIVATQSNVPVDKDAPLQQPDTNKQKATGWNIIGQDTFSPNGAGANAVSAIDQKDGFPVVLFRNEEIPFLGGAMLMKFDGAKWKIVGDGNIPNNKGNRINSETVDSLSVVSNLFDGNIYTAFGDSVAGNRDDDNGFDVLNGRGIVMKFDGNKWEMVGGKPFDENYIFGTYLSMSFNPASKHLYIAYFKEYGNQRYLFVKKFDGENWKDVGSQLVSSQVNPEKDFKYSNVVFDDENSQPYLAYTNDIKGGKIYILHFENSGKWVKEAITPPTEGIQLTDIFLNFNQKKRQLILSYDYLIENSNAFGLSLKTNVMSFDGTSFNRIATVPYNEKDFVSLIRRKNDPSSGDLYIAYAKGNNVASKCISIIKYSNDNWKDIASPYCFDNSNVYLLDFVIDNTGSPILIYNDPVIEAYKLRAVKFFENK